MMHTVVFERATPQLGPEGTLLYSRVGLSLNASTSGLCLLVDSAPSVGEVWRIQVPGAAEGMCTPTLADVRWTKPVPMVKSGLVVVGLRFLL